MAQHLSRSRDEGSGRAVTETTGRGKNSYGYRRADRESERRGERTSGTTMKTRWQPSTPGREARRRRRAGDGGADDQWRHQAAAYARGEGEPLGFRESMFGEASAAYVRGRVETGKITPRPSPPSPCKCRVGLFLGLPVYRARARAITVGRPGGPSTAWEACRAGTGTAAVVPGRVWAVPSHAGPRAAQRAGPLWTCIGVIHRN